VNIKENMMKEIGGILKQPEKAKSCQSAQFIKDKKSKKLYHAWK
jgi:hypothetical protein